VSRQLGIRQLLEEREESLSPYAQKCRLSKGRLTPEEPSPVRTDYQRDRDRIVHCKAFRRLKHKTQVFIAPPGDHYRTRLTHTLEVSQIARTIARALNLNEDLTEAISLGHDLGHTPFGHVGEDVLNELYKPGFHHNEQSLRVVDILENDGRGLNLTAEVRDGILNHSKSHTQVLAEDWSKISTYEGEIVRLADVVAYVNHDTDDAIRAGIITEEDLPEIAVRILGTSPSKRINTMVCNIIEVSWAVSGRIKQAAETIPCIGMSDSTRDATNALRDFLFERVYNVEAAREETKRARAILRRLFAYFLTHVDALPPESRIHGDDPGRWVVDYIAGMTDPYAEKTARELPLRER
jgi:dGTPase